LARAAVLVFGFFPFFLGIREGFEYLVVVECIGQMGGRVAQYGLALVLKQGSWVLLQESRTEHQPPKLGVVGSNPTPPATDEARAQGIVLCRAKLSSVSVLFHKRFCSSSSYEAGHVFTSFFFAKHFPVTCPSSSDDAK
jgi:hypothetical protein